MQNVAVNIEEVSAVPQASLYCRELPQTSWTFSHWMLIPIKRDKYYELIILKKDIEVLLNVRHESV
jgi:hypothetical protein